MSYIDVLKRAVGLLAGGGDVGGGRVMEVEERAADAGETTTPATPRNPNQAGVPDLPTSYLALDTHTHRSGVILEYDPNNDSWGRVEEIGRARLRDGIKDRKLYVTLDLYRALLDGTPWLKRDEVIALVYSVSRILLPGQSLRSGFTLAGLEIYVSIPPLVVRRGLIDPSALEGQESRFPGDVVERVEGLERESIRRTHDQVMEALKSPLPNECDGGGPLQAPVGTEQLKDPGSRTSQLRAELLEGGLRRQESRSSDESGRVKMEKPTVKGVEEAIARQCRRESEASFRRFVRLFADDPAAEGEADHRVDTPSLPAEVHILLRRDNDVVGVFRSREAGLERVRELAIVERDFREPEDCGTWWLVRRAVG